MKREITTNIKWNLATKTLPPDDVHEVLVYMRLGYITTVAIYKGHFNCSNEKSLNDEYDFLPGKDVLYWAYIPERLREEQNSLEEQQGKGQFFYWS